MNRLRTTLYTAAVFCALVPLAAPADTPSIGLTLNGLFGNYNTGRGATNVPLLPIPIVRVRVPVKRFELFAEGLPPIGPLSYSDGRGGSQATRVSYGVAEARYSFDEERYTVGVGESLLNQVTYFRRPGPIEQSSRVAGFRMSARVRLSSGLRDRTDLTVAASPRMHAVQRTAVYPISNVCLPFVPPSQCRPQVFGFNDPEDASLIDASLARTHALGSLNISYGVRYMNYVAHYPLPGNPQADHERFVMPFVGLDSSLGH
ncbi:MAG: hypothetical protein M3R35_08025 [Candidatus Eremiobacteraeota bacterium]|nr:hypothetical protein [Candidatus Eremiobacteraeota bacterium]